MPDHDEPMWQPFPADGAAAGDDPFDLELPFDDPFGDDDLISAARLAALVQDEEGDG